VASLPLRSSWAAGGASGCSSVSGNLSGNVSQNCTTTNAMQGESPSVWKSSLSDSDKEIKWKAIFHPTRDPFLGSRSNARGQNARVKHVLNDGDINAALLAAFYNARAGHYGTLNGSAEDYVRGLHDQLSDNVVSESQMLAAIQSTYNTQ
jgi:hypothetical protein